MNGIGHLAEAALRFDVSSIPSGMSLQSATLKIFVNGPTRDTYELFELKKPWSESSATWNDYASGLPWQVAGARRTSGTSLDLGSTVLGSFTGAPTGLKSVQLNSAGLGLVSAWVNNTAPNEGILLRSPLNSDAWGSTPERTPILRFSRLPIPRLPLRFRSQ